MHFSEGPFPLWSRLIIFMALEGFFTWRLLLGLVRQRFDVGDESGASTVTRRDHPIRYWSWACALAFTIGVFAWQFRVWVLCTPQPALQANLRLADLRKLCQRGLLRPLRRRQVDAPGLQLRDHRKQQVALDPEGLAG